MNDQKVKAKIYRFDPSKDKEPYYEEFDVPMEKNMVVMGALDYIHDNYRSDLAYRWFCGVKKCGQCGVMVNGKPALACWEPVSPQMTIEPLRNFKVIRDLVVDRTKYDAIISEAKLHLERKKPYPGFPEPLQHSKMKAAFELEACIECGICMAACPTLADKHFVEKQPFECFVGPTAMVQIAKYSVDPRDEADRFDLLMKGHIEQCDSCNDCTEACPLDIDVLGTAIDGLRDDLVESGRYYIRWWGLIKKMPRWLRRLTKCKLGLTTGEGPKKQ
jgi:succinate dehydrogenase/fumarate reductase iron-sulfur protein